MTGLGCWLPVVRFLELLGFGPFRSCSGCEVGHLLLLQEQEPVISPMWELGAPSHFCGERLRGRAALLRQVLCHQTQTPHFDCPRLICIEALTSATRHITLQCIPRTQVSCRWPRIKKQRPKTPRKCAALAREPGCRVSCLGFWVPEIPHLEGQHPDWEEHHRGPREWSETQLSFVFLFLWLFAGCWF